MFLYAAGREHPLREPCRRVLERVAEGTLPANTNVEVVQELLYVLWRRGFADEGIRLARSVVGLFPEMIALTREDLLRAMERIEERSELTPRDAIHVAAMERHGIETLVSADTHFDGVEGLRRIDPSALAE